MAEQTTRPPVEDRGRRVTFAKKLTATTATTVYTAPTGCIGAIAGKMKVANVDGTNAVDVTVEYYDGTTAFKMVPTYSLAADTFLDLDLLEIMLSPGTELRVTASAANDVEIVGVVREIYGR